MTWGWADICVCSSEDDQGEDEGLTPIVAPLELADLAVVDHTADALARLPWQLARLP